MDRFYGQERYERKLYQRRFLFFFHPHSALAIIKRLCGPTIKQVVKTVKCQAGVSQIAKSSSGRHEQG
jgi:hypothetical protein